MTRINGGLGVSLLRDLERGVGKELKKLNVPLIQVRFHGLGAQQ